MALTDNIVSYWSLNGDATDELGTNNASNSGVSFNASFGKIDQGADFDASSDLLSVTDNSTIKPVNISISVWVRADSLSGTQIFLDRYNAFTADGYRIYFSGNNVNGEIYNGAGRTVSGTTSLSTGTYYHVVLTYDGTTVTLYLNGSSEGTPVSTSGNITYSTTTNLGFGRRTGGTTFPLNGQMDEIGLWSRALTSDEVLGLYNSGSGLAYPFSSAAGPATLKTFNTIATASVKTIDTTAIASVKTINTAA